MRKLSEIGKIKRSKGSIFERFSDGVPIESKNKREILEKTFTAISYQEQSNFYPLVGEVLNGIGYNCVVTRGGDTNNRADAYVINDKLSFPIEIKSPTETPYINFKSIRQALENKIVLESRKFHPSSKNVSSVAIGFDYPAERSGVYELIQDIHTVYGYTIAILSIKDLLIILWDIEVDDSPFDLDKITFLKGRL